MTSYRLVVYDSPEHSFHYVSVVAGPALGLTPEDALEVLGEAHYRGRVTLAMPDLAAAEAALERVLALGPDPYIHGSRGSLVVAIEEVDGSRVVVRRRARRVAAETIELSDEDVATFVASRPSALPPVDPALGQPLLDVPGPSVWPSCLALLAAPVAMLAAIALLLDGAFPWLHTGSGRPGLVPLLVASLTAALPFLVFAFIRLPRGTRATLYEDHVAIAFTAVRLDELRGFRDGAAEGVDLVLPASSRDGTALEDVRGFVPGFLWRFPTPDEATRTAVLAHLVRKGVPRVE